MQIVTFNDCDLTTATFADLKEVLDKATNTIKLKLHVNESLRSAYETAGSFDNIEDDDGIKVQEVESNNKSEIVNNLVTFTESDDFPSPELRKPEKQPKDIVKTTDVSNAQA